MARGPVDCLLVGVDPPLARAAERRLREAGLVVHRCVQMLPPLARLSGAVAVLLEGAPSERLRVEPLLRRWGVRCVVVVCADGGPGPGEDARADGWLATLDLAHLRAAVQLARARAERAAGTARWRR